MVRTGLSEWMLARRYGAQRASEIAGDLVEQYHPARASWEMLRMALAIRGVELAGLILSSLLFVMIGSALYSAWPLRSMENERDLNVGWAWSMCLLLGIISLATWLVTASSALRLGNRNSITRSSLAFAVTLSLLSGFMLQPQLRRISPAVFAVVVLWRLRSSGAAATLIPVLGTAVVLGSLRLLDSTVTRGELYSCVVHMHTRGFQPPWFAFYTSCTSLATHNWFMCFVSSLFSHWLFTFLPARPERVHSS